MPATDREARARRNALPSSKAPAWRRPSMDAKGDTRLDVDEIEPPQATLAGDAMRERIASNLFGSQAKVVTIGRFQILERLGAGGMGVVYLAVDPKLGRRVAVKKLHASLTRSELERLRLLREAQALAKLSHPNVVQIYEVGEHEHSIFIAMEYVEGVALRAWQDAPHRWREIVAVYLQAGARLAAAHEA